MRLIFGLIAFIVGIFIFLFLVSAGVAMSVLGRLFGKRPAQVDRLMLQNLATLSPGEQALLADSVQKGQQTVGILSDQASLDSLIAKQIVVQYEGDGGIIYYKVADAAWAYLRR